MAKNSGDELLGFLSLSFTIILLGMGAKYIGWIDTAALVTGIAVLGGLTGLIMVIKLPWDLYFDAKSLAQEQQESVAKGLKVEQANIDFAKATAGRALALSIFIHVFSSAAIGAGTYFWEAGNIGYAFAAAYLLSMFLRPIAAFYKYQKIRLAQLREQCTFPRDDVWELKASVENVVADHKEIHQRLKNHEELTTVLQNESVADRGRFTSELKAISQKLDSRTERLGLEFEKAIEQLTEDKEVLRGLRAIVKLIKES